MTDNVTQDTPEIPDADVEHKSSGISAVWVIPIIAALIGGWLVFKSAAEDRAIAEVTFKNASGVEAGKTVVKFRNIKIGDVREVKFSDDLSSVVVVIELSGVKQDQLTDTTRFWVIKPRIGLGGVSGLDTLLSGAYIELDPGEGGQPATRFAGLEEPQNYQLGNPGTTYILRADKLGSLSRGSPIKLRGVQVGKVARYKLDEEHHHVDIEIFIRQPHDKHVNENTRFWNISGLDVAVGAEGIKLDIDSLTSLMVGGIAFSGGGTKAEAGQAPGNTVFTLYTTEVPEFEENHVFGVPLKLYFENGVNGLAIGAPVEFKGLRLGTVVDVGAEASKDKNDILTYAMIHIEPDRLPGGDRVTQKLDDEHRLKYVYQYIDRMVGRGMRAQLKAGNLLTGRSLVALDMFPGQAKTSLEYVDGVPVMPTVAETLTGILQQVRKVLARIESMPLEEISTNLEETTKNINSLMQSLNVAEGGAMGVQTAEVMKELAKAARSIRSMAEYLERHPEALLKGKQAD